MIQAIEEMPAKGLERLAEESQVGVSWVCSCAHDDCPHEIPALTEAGLMEALADLERLVGT